MAWAPLRHSDLICERSRFMRVRESGDIVRQFGSHIHKRDRCGASKRGYWMRKRPRSSCLFRSQALACPGPETGSGGGTFLPLLHDMRTRKDWKITNLQQHEADVAPVATTVEHRYHHRWRQPPPPVPITCSDSVISFSTKHDALGLAFGLRMSEAPRVGRGKCDELRVLNESEVSG